MVDPEPMEVIGEDKVVVVIPVPVEETDGVVADDVVAPELDGWVVLITGLPDVGTEGCWVVEATVAPEVMVDWDMVVEPDIVVLPDAV